MNGPLDTGAPALLARIAGRACDLVEVDAAAITRFSPPDRWDIAHVTTAAVARLEEATFTLGEGPTWDAWQQHRPVFVADLGTPDARSRWPVWSRDAASLGFRSAAAFPVQIGTIVLGALSVYRHAPLGLTEQQIERAAALADAVLVGLLDDLAGVPVEDEPSAVRELFSSRVYQASGMVMVQLGLDATQALVALRAYAFAEGRSLGEVAADIVARRFRFSVDGDPA